MNIEEVLSEHFIEMALKKVKRKKGSSGVDLLLAEELPSYWKTHGAHIKEELRNATYRPQPAFTRFRSKPGKRGKRKLEIPCVVDRMILSMISMAISPYYEAQFSPSSFGFRNGLGCLDALHACLEHLNNGAYFIVDLDIKDFFDKVNHALLFQILKKDIKDPILLHLIESYVKTVVVSGRHVYRKHLGLSQGFALSPLLANIYLNPFDQFLEQRQIRFVRYADDIVIFSNNLIEAEENLSLATTYLTENLKLQLNENKTKIVRPWEFHYLGYSFASTNTLKKFSLTIDNTIKIKMLTKMSKNIRKSYSSYEEWWKRLGAFNRGWVNYYKEAKPCVMLQFLQLVEQQQLFCFSEKVFANNQNLSCKYICALFDCKSYSSLTGWYTHSVVKNKKYLLRRIDPMANKYTYWRSYYFYNHRIHLLKEYDTLLAKPYFYYCHNNHYNLGLTCHQCPPPDTKRQLTLFEAFMIGILAAGKNMTLQQLYSYLLLKGQSIKNINHLRNHVNRLIDAGIIMRYAIYQKDPPHRHITCYRLSDEAITYAKPLCAPLDFRITDKKEKANIFILLYYHIATILWNQIVLNYIMFCPTLKRFRIEFVYTIPEYGKHKIPLYIETYEQNYFFSYLSVISENEIANLFQKWRFYKEHSKQKVLFILIANTYSLLCQAKGWLLKEIIFNKNIDFEDVAFSVVHSWYMNQPGIILPYHSIDV